VTGDARWLTEARGLTDLMIRFYGDETGSFYFTASDHEKLFARAKPVQDLGQPSGNSLAVRNLLRLAAKTGEQRYRTIAGRALKTFTSELEQNPAVLPAMAAAVDQYLAMAPPETPAAAPANGAIQLVAGQPPAGAKRSDSVVKVTASADKPGADGKQVVKITLTIEKGWHAYANPVGNNDLTPAQTTVVVSGKIEPKSVSTEYPKGKVVVDPVVGNYLVYEGTAVIKAVVQRAAGDSGPLDVTVKFQACNDKTCLLPATVKLHVP
ncbi:MAG TPA: protein-disulfide reductase DsbD domain-containing protein, partial [Gemmataceae bacterium]|nr:protein-disulfide reductase DsbD domain-containing protein [Gemmataceae bacterium]